MSEDAVYPIKDAPPQYDRKRVLEWCKPATLKVRAEAKRLKKTCARADAACKEAWGAMHEFRKHCPHPEDAIVVKQYGMSDDWSRASWTVASAYCDLCGDRVEPGDHQSWNTGNW